MVGDRYALNVPVGIRGLPSRYNSGDEAKPLADAPEDRGTVND